MDKQQRVEEAKEFLKQAEEMVANNTPNCGCLFLREGQSETLYGLISNARDSLIVNTQLDTPALFD